MRLDEMFQLACGHPQKGGFGISPSEFWQMTPVEFWWLYDFHIGNEVKDKRETMDRLKRIYHQSREEK